MNVTSNPPLEPILTFLLLRELSIVVKAQRHHVRQLLSGDGDEGFDK
jgi:hypothetical protein